MARKSRLVAALVGLAILGHASAGMAQAPDRLAAARKLFAEALHDEEQKNYAVALEKFRSVQQVRSTLPVRYRIASCLEELGRLREALHDFRAIEGERASEPGDAEIVQTARDKASSIERRTPHVALQLSSHAPADAVVTLDGQALAGSAVRGEPIAVDPGDHEIKATATGAAPFASRFTVAEQANLSLQVPLDPAPVTPPPPPPPAPPPPAPDSSRKTVGIVLVATGGAFAIASVVTLILRRGDINTLNAACNNGACPADRQSELTSTHSRALFEGPLAIVFGVAAVAAGGVGGYFLLTPAPPPPTAAPASGTSGAMLTWQGAF